MITTPAEREASATMAKVTECLAKGQCFKLEAGAGAGKTHSLVQSLIFVTKHSGEPFARCGRKIACVTYTNVATDEIRRRTDGHPAIYPSTIHSFCWEACKGFQKALRELLPDVDGWNERLREINGLGSRTIEYDLGHARAKPDEKDVKLSHDDVLKLFVRLLERPKFRNFIASRFPVIFIDEYQDTEKEVAESIKRHFIDKRPGPLIGLFGDAWQKIYNHGCGSLSSPRLLEIPKGANFRSSDQIISALNNMRPGLRQGGQGRSEGGCAAAFHTNGWPGLRQGGQHFKDDLPEPQLQEASALVKATLAARGWDLSPQMTKVLMLTHKALAREQSYSNLVNCFKDNDRWHKKEDPLIQFLLDSLLPACDHYLNKRYGQVFSALGADRGRLDKHSWRMELDKINHLRPTATIGSLLNSIADAGILPLPDKVRAVISAGGHRAAEPPDKQRTDVAKLLTVPVAEVERLGAFIDERTPYATKHGVKGAEFENVLVIFGRGWGIYDWNKFLELSDQPIDVDQAEFFERNRNLFYVACSRPKTKLAVLFTQKLSPKALAAVHGWFGGAEDLSSLR